MADCCDDAQAREAQFLVQALARAHARPGQAAEYVDGVACCAECGEAIPEARRKALPGVGLCVGCAEELIRITGGW